MLRDSNYKITQFNIVDILEFEKRIKTIKCIYHMNSAIKKAIRRFIRTSIASC
jgi:hypothetical protein